MDSAINICRNVITRCTSFQGRIDRHQYWTYILCNLILVAVGAWFTVRIPKIYLWQIITVLMLLPYISATVKRLHDVNKSGCWLLCILVPVFGWIYLFLLCIEDSKDEANRYGQPCDWTII